MELVREKIVLNKHIGREMTQVLLEGDIIVPDIKPDISSVLKSEAEVVISKANPAAGRISYSGKLTVKILYLAKDQGDLVHSISITSPVDDFINMEGVDPSMWIELNTSIAGTEYRIVNDRKLNYRIVSDVVVNVTQNASAQMVKGIDLLPAAQQKTAKLSMSNMVEKKSDEFTIKDELTLPGIRPAIKELLSTNISIASKEVRVNAGRVDISGNLLVTPLYIGTDEDSVIEFAEFEMPFSGAIDVASAKEGNFGDVNLSILESAVTPTPDADGEDRALDIEVIVGADIKISEVQELTILEDAYSIDQSLVMSKESLEYSHLVCRNKNQFNVKETVSIEEGPEILQILTVSGNMRLEETKVVDDKVVVEGIVVADILYVAGSDETPLSNHQAILPVRQVVETRGSRLGMDAVVEQSIDHIGFNMLSSNEVELRFVLNMDATVTQTGKAEYISDIEFTPLAAEQMDQMPSMVVLCVQKNDSLWSIAKKYNASLEELAAINDIESTAELAVGQKLLVVKKVASDEE